MKILAIGDIVSKQGCEYLRQKLPALKKEYGADIVIANGENSAVGNGIFPQSAKYIFDSGVDVITLGNHALRRQEIYDYLKTTLKKEPRFLLNLLVNKIIVYKDKIEIFFNFTNRTPPTPPIPPEDTPDSLHRVSFSAVCSSLSTKCPPYSFGRHFAKRRNAARFIETNDIPPADSEKTAGGVK